MAHEDLAILTAFVVAAASALFDWRTRHIPNSLTVGALVLGIALHASSGAIATGFAGGLRGAGFALFGAILCGAIPAIGFARGEMGGGDVKLFAALGALLGPRLGFDSQAYAFAILWLVLLPVRLIATGQVRAFVRSLGVSFRQLLRRPNAEAGSDAGFRLPPMVLAPTIFAGFCLAVMRDRWLP
jgi:prepilin peptidase CpaA